MKLRCTCRTSVAATLVATYVQPSEILWATHASPCFRASMGICHHGFANAAQTKPVCRQKLTSSDLQQGYVLNTNLPLCLSITPMSLCGTETVHPKLRAVATANRCKVPLPSLTNLCAWPPSDALWAELRRSWVD